MKSRYLVLYNQRLVNSCNKDLTTAEEKTSIYRVSSKSDKSRKLDSQVGRVGNGRKSTTEGAKKEEKQQIIVRPANNMVSP